MTAVANLWTFEDDWRAVVGRVLGAGHAPPVEYHVSRDRGGLWLVARQAETVGRYYSEASARELACWCAVKESEQGQPARVHWHDGASWTLGFVTTDHTCAELFG